MRILWKDGAIGRPFFGLGFVTLALLSALGHFCFSFDPYDLCKSCDFVGCFSLADLPRLRLGESSLVDVGQSAGFEDAEWTTPDCTFRGLPLAAVFVVDGLNVLLLTPLMIWDLSALSDDLVPTKFVATVRSSVELLEMS